MSSAKDTGNLLGTAARFARSGHGKPLSIGGVGPHARKGQNTTFSDLPLQIIGDYVTLTEQRLIVQRFRVTLYPQQKGSKC
jgi:hypothetical protein